MAYRWRIRHKLLLGLVLVVAIVTLSLLGTLNGLHSYDNTMQAVRGKIIELKKAQKIRDSARWLRFGSPKKYHDEHEELSDLTHEANDALKHYSNVLETNIHLGFAHLDGVPEKGHVNQLHIQLKKLEEEILKLQHDYSAKPGEASTKSREKEQIKDGIERIWVTSNDLVGVIYGDLNNRQKQAEEASSFNRGLVLTICIAGIILLASLLPGFYKWTFGPIRNLKQGTDQIAQGDFHHHIDVKSGDEMEELAAAFNHMTEQLREIYGDLERQVNERSRQLVRSERLASVGFLAAGVAHEINNPLASIAFCSEALEHRLNELFAQIGQTLSRPTLMQTTESKEQQDRDKIKRYVEMIQREAFRCKEITQKLLEFSRGGDRKFEPVDICDVVRGVLDIAEHLENCRGKQLHYDPPAPLVAFINAQEMKSVILNLVVNALESMEEGGELTISQRQRDGMAEIYFTDTGCGMTPEILENIFEPFYTQSRTGKGTGLGLSISHRIMNQHGGEIAASSPGPGHGSTFVVRVPLRPSDTPLSQSTEDVEPQQSQWAA